MSEVLGAIAQQRVVGWGVFLSVLYTLLYHTLLSDHQGFLTLLGSQLLAYTMWLTDIDLPFDSYPLIAIHRKSG